MRPIFILLSMVSFQLINSDLFPQTPVIDLKLILDLIPVVGHLILKHFILAIRCFCVLSFFLFENFNFILNIQNLAIFLIFLSVKYLLLQIFNIKLDRQFVIFFYISFFNVIFFTLPNNLHFIFNHISEFPPPYSFCQFSKTIPISIQFCLRQLQPSYNINVFQASTLQEQSANINFNFLSFVYISFSQDILLFFTDSSHLLGFNIQFLTPLLKRAFLFFIIFILPLMFMQILLLKNPQLKQMTQVSSQVQSNFKTFIEEMEVQSLIVFPLNSNSCQIDFNLTLEELIKVPIVFINISERINRINAQYIASFFFPQIQYNQYSIFLYSQLKQV